MTDPELPLRRAAVVSIYDVGETTVILAPDGQLHELVGASAELAREVLALTLRPRTRAEIVAHLAAQAGAALSDGEAAVVDELLRLLTATGALEPVTAEPARDVAPGAARRRLVLGLCGAVAAALAPGLIALLQRRGFELRVIATPTATRFVRAEALAALVHHPVRTSMWADDGDVERGQAVPHIDLARWADAVLVWPATATTISRLATGDCSDLVAAVALTCRAPVVVVPSMNAEMRAAAAVERNLRQLVADGLHVVHPGSGPELADAPARRQAAFGSTPPHAVVVALLEGALRVAEARGAHRREGPPRDADAWDDHFRGRAEHELAWHVDALDEDLAAALARSLTAGASVLDVGTGLGVAACAAARLGARVVAIDISEVALARARARAGDAPIVWLRDDITQTRLCARFDVVIDRGCLHLLAPADAPAYARALARLCRPGGALLLKTHAVAEGRRRATTPYDADAIVRLLGGAFALESDTASTLPGPAALGEAPAARLFVLRRRDP